MSGELLARDYPLLVGATPRGETLPDGIVLPLGKRAVPAGRAWQPVTPSAGTEVLACRLRQQEPGKDATDQAVATKRVLGKGAILAVYGPVFRDYFLEHSPALREWIGNLVDGLRVPWAAEAAAPPHLEMILRRKEGKLLVNLINRGSGETLSESRPFVEELPPVENVVVRVRRERRPKSVTVAPAGTKLRWSYENGLAVINVPRVEIHQVLVIE